MTYYYSGYRAVAAALAIIGSNIVAPNAFAAGDPTGVWINDTGRGAVEIKPCGKALCGRVVWVKDTSDTKGCGKQIIGDAESAGGGTWDNGWIYSPEKRKNYDVELKPLNNGTLRVVGYAGTKLFSRTMIWTRAPADLKRCGETPAITAAATPSKSETLTAPSAVKPPDQKTAAVEPEPAKPAAPVAAASEAPNAAASDSTNPQQGTANSTDAVPAEAAKTEPDKNAGTTTNVPSSDPKNQPANTDVTKSDDDEAQGGEKLGERKHGKKFDLGELKLGDLGLDKVLTRTKSGKCKLNLPFVKVVINCVQD